MHKCLGTLTSLSPASNEQLAQDWHGTFYCCPAHGEVSYTEGLPNFICHSNVDTLSWAETLKDGCSLFTQDAWCSLQHVQVVNSFLMMGLQGRTRID